MEDFQEGCGIKKENRIRRIMDANFLVEIRETKKCLDAKKIELNKQLIQLGKEMADLQEKCPHDNIVALTDVDQEDPPYMCPDCGYFN